MCNIYLSYLNHSMPADGAKAITQPHKPLPVIFLMLPPESAAHFSFFSVNRIRPLTRHSFSMASGQLSRAEALACTGCRHACHVMLYSDTKSQLFKRFPIRHIILMQMRFDGLLGFPGGFVNLSKESLEEGLSRELLEEIGVAVPVSEENHVESCFTPPTSSSSSSSSSPSSSSSSSSGLILHFYVKKMEEEQILEIERMAPSTASDHGQEVLGMVRVPLYQTKGGGLSAFLSHSFIGNARLQLVNALLRFDLISPEHLHRALSRSMETHRHNAQDLRSALALTKWTPR